MSLARYLSKLGALLSSDGQVPAAGLASGAAVANIGYTPVNKAGDSLTGGLTFPDGVGVAGRYMSHIGGTGSTTAWFKVCRLQMGQNGQASILLIGCTESFGTGQVTGGAQMFIECQNGGGINNMRVDGWRRRITGDIKFVYANEYDATIWIYGGFFWGGSAVVETLDATVTMYADTAQTSDPGGYSKFTDLVAL